nr:acyl carrier protein [Rhodococcus sp. (in: high G+C Gram-positive bacteria)]
MTVPQKTAPVGFDDLARIIKLAAGDDETAPLTDGSIDVPLCDLGYDSLAMLETVSRVEREFGLTIDDSVASTELSVREFLDAVNKAA